MARRGSRSNQHLLSQLMAIALLVVSGCSPGGTAAEPSPNQLPSRSIRPATTPEADPTVALPLPSAPSTAQPTSPVSAAWRQLEPGGALPSAREDGTWTEDPNGRTAYLFGGRDAGTILDDLWTFDLDTDNWTRLDPGGAVPPARFGHDGVWVDGIGLVVFAGQAGPTTFFNDLWAYDPDANRWTELTAAGSRPKARYGTCAAVGPDGRLWISHGFTEDGTRFADTQAFDFTMGRWSDETPAGQLPVSRCLHGCFWTDDGRLALYAGQTTGVEALGDLWTLDRAGTPTAAWTKATGQLPPDRNLYAFTRHGDAVVVFGGRSLGSSFLDDVFTVDATSLVVKLLQPPDPRPPGRGGSMLIDDPVRGRVLLLGGKTANRTLDDLWELSLR